MPTEDHDSWLGALGIDVDQIRNKVQGVVGDVETKVEQGIDSVVQGATQLYKDAENAVTARTAIGTTSVCLSASMYPLTNTS